MPRYRNDSDVSRVLEDKQGDLQTIRPGETIDTYQFYSISDLTELSVTPLKNRNSAITQISLGSEKAHVLNGDTRKFLVININGQCTVKPQITEAVPLMLNNTETSVVLPFILEDYPCAQLLVSGSGSCTIMELKW